MPRLNIYLDDPGLRQRVRIAAARRGISISEYCSSAIEQRVLADEAEAAKTPVDLADRARRMDEIRKEWGKSDIEASELVREGRRL